MPPGLLSKVEYQQILQNPAVYLTDPKLKTGEVDKDPVNFLPRVRSGGLALTYRITLQNKKWALRCFHKLAPDRELHYSAITRFLTSHPSTILVNTDYQPQGIRYQGNFYPITLMEWVEGETLGTYVFNNIRNSDVIRNLPEYFLNIVSELDRLQIAHGDLSHSNIIISNGHMILIDYDGMFVPELHGQKSTETGNPNFQHPGRNENHFSPFIDQFSEIVIYLALKAISISPDLYQKYGLGGEGMLFNQSDFRSPNDSKLIADLKKIPSLSAYAQNFARLCQASVTSIPSLSNFLENRAIEVQLVDAAPTAYSSPSSSWPINAQHLSELFENENESVVVIGKIDRYRIANTLHGNPCVFLNVGAWPNQFFTVVMWSEVLDLLKAAGRKPEDFRDQWISVSGIISIYSGKPQIILESPADIAIITEEEALIRLNRKNQALIQARERTTPRIETMVAPNSSVDCTSTLPVNSSTVSISQPNVPAPISQPANVVKPSVSTGPKQGGENPISVPLSKPSASITQPIRPKLDTAAQMNKLYGASGQIQRQAPSAGVVSPNPAPPSAAIPSVNQANKQQIQPPKHVASNSNRTAGVASKKKATIWNRITIWFKKNF